MVHSSWSYTCTFPKDAEIDKGCRAHLKVKEDGGRLKIEDKSDGYGYIFYLLDELVELFGKPLDEVDRLELDAWYRYDEDDCQEVKLHIEDGAINCEKTKKVWVPATLEGTGFSIRPRTSP